MKVSEVKKIAQKELGERVKVRRLTQEASQREYFKLESWTYGNRVLCYLNPHSGNHKKTLKIYKGFKKSGFEHFPEIYSHKSDLGITIQKYIPLNLYDIYGLNTNETNITSSGKYYIDLILEPLIKEFVYQTYVDFLL